MFIDKVIKNAASQAGPFGSGDEIPLQEPTGRISKYRIQILVQNARTSATDDGKKFHPHRRVLRNEDTRYEVLPVEIANLETELTTPPLSVQEPIHASKAERPYAAPDIETLRNRWQEEWRQQADVEIEKAREEAFKQAYETAHAEMEDELENFRLLVVADLEKLRQAWNEFIAQSEPLLVELAFEIAQTLLDSPLPSSVKGISARAISEAVEQLSGNTPIEIELHPIDFLHLQENGLVDQLESIAGGIRWNINPNLKVGEWIIQSPTAMIRRLQEELISTLKSRIGLLSAVHAKSNNSRSASNSTPS